MPQYSEDLSYFRYIWQKFRYNPPGKAFFDALSMFGIRIEPYYLFREGLSHKNHTFFKFDHDNYRIAFLGPDYMKLIAAIPFRNISEEALLSRIEEGNKCLGVLYKENLIVFSWCDLKFCNYPGCRFPLKKDEAYLFDAYTFSSFRGKGLASYIRYQWYLELEKLGKENLYSVSQRYNKSSISFKKKLGAKVIASGLYIEIFHRWKFTVTLKEAVLHNK